MPPAAVFGAWINSMSIVRAATTSIAFHQFVAHLESERDWLVVNGRLRFCIGVAPGALDLDYRIKE